jgi:hypothetical protein
MLAAWTEILPLFIVRWLARRYCERDVRYAGGYSRLGVRVEVRAA